MDRRNGQSLLRTFCCTSSYESQALERVSFLIIHIEQKLLLKMHLLRVNKFVINISSKYGYLTLT